LIPASAWALPAPKTEAEMMQMADLVVEASCVQVLCDGAPVSRPDKVVTKYLSTLFPSKSEKGGLPNSFQIRGEDWAWIGPAPVGGWHQQPVAKGWAGKLYLEKKPDGTYAEVWWNAMIEDQATSKPQPLPACAQTDGGPAPKDTGVQDSSPATDADVRDALLADSGPTPDTGAADSSTGADSGATVRRDDGCSCTAGGEAVLGFGPILLLLLLGLLSHVRARSRRP
jgi:hypothetical protein